MTVFMRPGACAVHAPAGRPIWLKRAHFFCFVNRNGPTSLQNPHSCRALSLFLSLHCHSSNSSNFFLSFVPTFTIGEGVTGTMKITLK